MKPIAILFLLSVLIAAPAIAAFDGLDEVNAYRARWGMVPFHRDDALTIAAGSAADYRASYRIGLHTSNDFAFVPAGAQAVGSGTGNSSGMMGWCSCYATSGYPYAGAAWATDQYGTRYMHLFVTNQPNGPVARLAQATVAVAKAVTHPVQAVQAVRDNREMRTYQPRRRFFFRRWQ